MDPMQHLPALADPALSSDPPRAVFSDPPPAMSFRRRRVPRVSGRVPARIVDSRYALRGTLCAGETGVVYEGLDLPLGRRVAVKLVTSPPSAEADVVHRPRREAQLLARIAHPNVVAVHAAGHDGDAHYLVMEYLDGETLDAVLDRHRAAQMLLEVSDAVRLVRGVLAGLAAVHAAEVLHLDVRPHNVLVEHASGLPVLIDFGLATRAGEATPGEGGSGPYLAPERVGTVDAPVDVRADVYAVGCVLYELLTGSAPGLTPDRPRPSTRRPSVSPFDAVVARALATRPEDRFETCIDMAEAVGAAMRAFERECRWPIDASVF